MHWRVKGVVQKTLSLLPLGNCVNDVLQRRVGGLRRFGRAVTTKVEDWADLVDRLAEIGVRPAGLRFLEIGTGWFPTLPVCFSIAGAQFCRTYDLHRKLSPRLTMKMLGALQMSLPRIAAAVGRPLCDCESAYAALSSAANVADLFRAARIDYHAPADAAVTDLADESVDVIFSNSVLEHVEPDAIAAIMRESRRVLRKNGVAIHSVNCGDHYAYFDRRITPINYMKYSKADWQFWDNRMLYQNRLRPMDFLRIAEQAGLQIVLDVHRPKEALMAELPHMALAQEFNHYPAEQLCTTSVTFAAKKSDEASTS
jgi:SAM-dependent methyltransferase